MNEEDYLASNATSMSPYVAGSLGSGAQVLTVSIQKIDNGYVVALEEPAKVKPYKESEKTEPLSSKEREKTDDEKIDAMVEGIVAFQKYIMDRSAGEDWKADDIKEKVREGFKAFFPSVPRRRLQAYKPIYPRIERMVFPTVGEVLEYLKKNL